MDNDNDCKMICFWTKASKEDIAAILKKAEIDVPYTVTPDSPGGAVTIVMGNEFFKAMQARGAIAKNRTLTSSRGVVHESSFGRFLVSYDPGLRHVEADAIAQITWDIRLAKRFLTRGDILPTLGEYTWHEDLSDFIDQLEGLYDQTGEPVEFACDTETMGLWPWYDDKHIISIQVSCKPGTAHVVYVLGMDGRALEHLKTQLRWLFTTPKAKLRGANWKFDALWLWLKMSLVAENFTMDTTAVGSLLDENRSNSLKWHVKQHVDDLGGYDDELNEKYDMAHIEQVPKEVLGRYAGGDADATLRVATVFKKELLRERHLARFYVKLLHPALKAFEKVERRGVLVDRDRYAALRSELVSTISEHEAALIDMLSPRLRIKHQEMIRDKLAEGKSPLTAKLLTEHFFDKSYGMGLTPRLRTAKNDSPSTAHEHLVMFNDVPEAKEFVKVFEKLGVARKTLSTYVDGFLAHLRPDNRFHPTYLLFNGEMYDDGSVDGGTVTGRLSCKNPAMQTFPKHSYWAKKLRKCLIAPPGYVCWQFDYSQGELRIAACDAGETRMIEAYNADADVHGITGATFAGMPAAEFLQYKKAPDGSKEAEIYAKYRQRGKHANFGMIFEISAAGFQVYCRRKELHISLEESEQYLDKFFQTWPRLRPWQEESKVFARKHGFVMSPLGRIRHLPLINSRDHMTRGRSERQAINSKIQSTLSDLCIWAVSLIEEELGDDAGVIGTTHDAAYGYVKEDRISDILPRIGQIMGNLPYKEVFDWEPPLNFPVDGEFGPNMAELAKFKL